jgi:DnaJ-class molecular chaperone
MLKHSFKGFKDYYSILKIDQKSSQKEIKSSFFKLAKEFHPDIVNDDKIFKEISEAYGILSNE